MAKTRKEISADARARKKQNNQRLLTKYIPTAHHDELSAMLANTKILKDILVYYKQLVESEEHPPCSEVNASKEEETSLPVKEPFDETHSNSQSIGAITDDDQVVPNIEESIQDKLDLNNSPTKEEYLDTENKEDSFKYRDTTIDSFDKFILDHIKSNPTISTRYLSRLAAKAGFAKMNSKTKLPGTKVGTDRVARVRKKYRA